MRTAALLTLANFGTAFAAVQVYGQCGGSAYTGDTECPSGSSCVEASKWYSQCIPSSKGAPSSTKAASVEKSDFDGATAVATAIPVSGELDGGMTYYDRSPAVCRDQEETGEADAMFILEDGATLRNVIIGPGQAEGVHCKGSCTLENVWFEDVCEDAITLKQKSGTSVIRGGGAFHASDKVVQFNGRGTVEISDFYVEDYGKLVRSCGNCKDNGGPRNVVIENIAAVNGGVLCGINTNYGDTCTISNTCQDAGKNCDLFEGNSDGSEPIKLSSGPDGTSCKVDSFAETC
ncbi:pectate lyase-domain-containing protein [Fusarium acuminatum]|uniref:Pectate lyase n=1 Tax=Fusarium acuminatum TaxID=5515 RepID=A0ABZ2WSE5_9HYPO